VLKNATIESSESEYRCTFVWRCPKCRTRNRSTRPSSDLLPRVRCGSCHQAFYLVHPKQAEPCR